MKDPVTQIKAWLFPSLITLLAGIIWNDVKEIKGDVKALIAQSNIDKTRIDNLERVIFQGKSSSNIPTKKDQNNNNLALLAVMPNNKEIDNAQNKKKKS
jgi:hypothetical protein